MPTPPLARRVPSRPLVGAQAPAHQSSSGRPAARLRDSARVAPRASAHPAQYAAVLTRERPKPPRLAGNRAMSLAGQASSLRPNTPARYPIIWPRHVPPREAVVIPVACFFFSRLFCTSATAVWSALRQLRQKVADRPFGAVTGVDGVHRQLQQHGRVGSQRRQRSETRPSTSQRTPCCTRAPRCARRAACPRQAPYEAERLRSEAAAHFQSENDEATSAAAVGAQLGYVRRLRAAACWSASPGSGSHPGRACPFRWTAEALALGPRCDLQFQKK